MKYRWWLAICLVGSSFAGFSGCTEHRSNYSYEPIPTPPPRKAAPAPTSAPGPVAKPEPQITVIQRGGHSNVVVELPPAQPLPDSVVAWDAVEKSATVPFGTDEAHFDFNLTNVSPATVAIRSAASSCFCTVAKLPAEPWMLQPGTSGQIHVTMDLSDKHGRLTKAITVTADQGTRMLLVNVTILPEPAKPIGPMGPREQNRAAAKADRQAVLRGECARCHVEPGRGKFGKDLYVSVCGVCHEAERRATMVPNLHALSQPTNATFWRNWIVNGKAGTLMPAFTLPHGGFMSDAQVDSLVVYLVENMPSMAGTNAVPMTH